MSVTAESRNVDSHIREVTAEEVADFRKNGWASLPGLVSPELAGELLAQLKQLTGIDRDELREDDPESQRVIEKIRAEGRKALFFMSRMQDETVWEVATASGLGEAAAALTGIRPLRLFTDGVICKLPDWTEKQQVGPGIMTGQTPWHQDLPPMPMDRVGGVQFWLALTEITPEMGSMQHLSGSQREPPLGCTQFTEDQKMEELYPEVFERYEVSPPHHFHPGDVLAHDSLTLHFAESNKTERLRWVYTSYRIPANALFNGVPNPRFEEFGFEQWKPFDHPKFPIVAA
jgi:ectoine hydroxylase-related dioxygenase (phytanoyl-CoA dioxygenase family)